MDAFTIFVIHEGKDGSLVLWLFTLGGFIFEGVWINYNIWTEQLGNKSSEALNSWNFYTSAGGLLTV